MKTLKFKLLIVLKYFKISPPYRHIVDSMNKHLTNYINVEPQKVHYFYDITTSKLAYLSYYTMSCFMTSNRQRQSLPPQFYLPTHKKRIPTRREINQILGNLRSDVHILCYRLIHYVVLH